MTDIRIAVACDDPAEVALALKRDLMVEFEVRESSFWGSYWTDLPRRHIRVFFNEDPMHIAGSDPPDEVYFEATVPNHRTLVDIQNDEVVGNHVAAILSARFPESRIIVGSSA